MTPAEHELVTAHLPLVQSLARKLAAQLPWVERDDLVSAGREGLIQAAQRFDPSRGVAFSTFAYYRIRGAMFDGVRRAGAIVQGVPRSRGSAFAERADEYLEPRAADPPPPDATAAAEKLATMVADLSTSYLLCASRDVADEPDSSIPDPSQVAEAREELSIVRRRMARLPEAEQKLLRLMYFEDLTMLDAAAQLGMSKGWASRLHARALERLRKDVRASSPPPAVRV
jgi:RNA polymerase sigma factor for flagellar operon FliA